MIVPPWGVVWAYDPWARPPKPKLWAAIAPSRGWSIRINSQEQRGSVLLRQDDHADFLSQDSWLHCWGDLIEVDDFVLQQLLGRQFCATRTGLLGMIAASARRTAVDRMRDSPLLSPYQKRLIFHELGV